MQKDRILWDGPPYCAWMLHKDPTRDGPWGIKGAGGWNCFGFNGAVFLPSQEVAEQIIREAGHTPGPVVRG